MGLSDDTAVIARRYDRLAPLYRLVEPAFLMPPHLRGRAVAALGLTPGDHVLELGCGSGRNLPGLCRAVGPEGRVTGVDVSAGMLERAERWIAREGVSNVALRRGDAAALTVEPVDAALLSLSYTVMPRRREVLSAAWAALRPGGTVTILDAGSHGRLGALLEVPSRWLSRLTVLGEPTIRPWEELEAVAPEVRTDFFLGGAYVITSARKPAPAARA